MARPKCGQLYKIYRKSDFIIDGESYFTLSNSVLAGNDSYYSNDRIQTPDDVKHFDKAKYEPKVLVWIAISPKGLSKPYFRPSEVEWLLIKKYTYQEVYKEYIQAVSDIHSRTS